MPGTPFKPASNIENPSFLREYIKTIHDTMGGVFRGRYERT